MPKQRFTMTGTDIFERAKRTFGDESGVQIRQDDVLRWINDGQRSIIESSPILLAKATTSVVKDKGTYEFPDSMVHHIQALHYDGTPLTPLSFQDAQHYIFNKETSAESGTPDIWYEYNGEITIWPKPELDVADGLVLYFVQDPKELTAMTDKLSIPDSFFNALFGLVMQQAYALDENWQGLQAMKDMSVDSLNRLQGQERKEQINFYPFINVSEDDAW